MGDNSTMASTSQVNVPATFRLFDLPGEIRNRIYSYALPGKDNAHSRRVANCRFPAITRASKQLGKETLPIFFAETNFVFNVGTNAVIEVDRKSVDEDIERYAGSKSGVLNAKPVFKGFIKSAGNSALFRVFTFKIFTGFDFVEMRSSTLDVVDTWLFMLTVTFEHRNVVRVRARKGRYHPQSVGAGKELLAPREVKLLDKLLQAVLTKAQELGAREGFKGFKMSDLARIARVFRV